MILADAKRPNVACAPTSRTGARERELDCGRDRRSPRTRRPRPRMDTRVSDRRESRRRLSSGDRLVRRRRSQPLPTNRRHTWRHRACPRALGDRTWNGVLSPDSGEVGGLPGRRREPVGPGAESSERRAVPRRVLPLDVAARLLAHRALGARDAHGLMAACDVVARRGSRARESRPPSRIRDRRTNVSVPTGLFLFASNNPSGLTVAGVVAYWCAAYAYMSDARERQGRTLAAVAVMALSALMALASRSDAGVYIGVASLVVWISTGGYLPGLRRRSVTLLGVSAAGAVVALMVSQSVQAIEGGAAGYTPPLTVVLFDNARELPRLVLGSLGTYPLGSLDTPMPGVVSTLMLLVFGGAGRRRPQRCVEGEVDCGCRRRGGSSRPPDDRARHEPPSRRVSGLCPASLHAPLLPMLVGTAVMPPRGHAGIGLHRRQVWVLACAVVVAQAAALHTTISPIRDGLGRGGPDLGQGVEWWWAALAP